MAVENFNRLRIRLVVSLSPGIHLRALQRLLGTSFSTVRYHVRCLTGAHEISCGRDRGFSRLYPFSTSGDDRLIYSALSSRVSRAILKALVERNEMSNKQLCDVTGLAKSTVSEHLGRFLELGLARKVLSADGPHIYVPNSPYHILRVLQKTDETPIRATVARFIELWDF